MWKGIVVVLSVMSLLFSCSSGASSHQSENQTKITCLAPCQRVVDVDAVFNSVKTYLSISVQCDDNVLYITQVGLSHIVVKPVKVEIRQGTQPKLVCRVE